MRPVFCEWVGFSCDDEVDMALWVRAWEEGVAGGERRACDVVLVPFGKLGGRCGRGRGDDVDAAAAAESGSVIALNWRIAVKWRGMGEGDNQGRAARNGRAGG